MRQKILILLCALMTTVSASAYDFSYDYKGQTLYFNYNNNCEPPYGYEGLLCLTNGDIKYSGSVTIPSTIEYNGKYYCVSTIGTRAFEYCTGLSSITIEGSYVNEILSRAFQGCSNLTSINYPDALYDVHIGDFAFNNCSKLQSIDFPWVFGHFGYTGDSGQYAIGGCSSLTDVRISSNNYNIPYCAFSGCSSLTSIVIPNSVTSVDPGAFSGCRSLTSIVIPNSVTSVGREAFYGCRSLTSIVIPNSVTSIGFCAFQNCTSLISIKVINEKPSNISLGEYVFSKVPTSTCTLYIPKGSKALYESADQWRDFDNIVEFFYCVSLTDGEAYTATEDQEDIDVTYTRTFNNTEWQPLYVPFNMSYEEWSEYADVAEVYNVRAYDTDNDEKIDDIAIEFNKLTSGEIVPNVPYVIRAKNKGTVTFECTGKTLLAAPEEEGTIECSSTKMIYSFHGIYQSKSDLYSSGVYHLSGGEFRRAKSDAAVLSPNRFYLKITPKTGGYNPSSLPQKIRMIVDGEEVSTGIDDIEIDSENNGIYYDLIGRQVTNPTRGVYIQNGKKVIIK